MNGALLTLLTLLGGLSSQSPCAEAEVRALLQAQELIARGDADAALLRVDAVGPPCGLRVVARLSLQGWNQARALATGGGAVELQGPVRETLDSLGMVAATKAWALEVEYADALIRAAIAAAQDERPEMELLLAHARDLAERLQQRSRPALWPRPYNLASGELWFEVDRFADAAAAYERAVRTDAAPEALVGLARALARLGRDDEACQVYRRVTNAAEALVAKAASDLARCQ